MVADAGSGVAGVAWSRGSGREADLEPRSRRRSAGERWEKDGACMKEEESEDDTEGGGGKW